MTAGGAHVDQLRGVVEKEDAASRQPLRENAASAGFYESASWGTAYPKIQLRTVADLLAGKGLDYPHMIGATFKRAPRVETERPAAESLPGLG
jgi:site-specific DNA-methyltransferase (adenine-specific)